MQVKKEDIRLVILEIAKKEFMSKGYKGTSMRNIASLSGIGLSNIYNYFKNKDDLFKEVLSPLIAALDLSLVEHNSDKHLSLDVFVSSEYQIELINVFMKLIKDYRQELKILLFHSSGSSLSNYREVFTDKQTMMGLEYINIMQNKYKHINADISKFFIHTISAWWMAIMGEIISHDELGEEGIKKFLSEYVAFSTAGWKKLLKA